MAGFKILTDCLTDETLGLFNNPCLPVEYDPVWAGRLEGEEHGEPVAVGQAADTDSVFVAVDVVDEEGVADEARHVDVDLLLALAAAELRDESDLKIIYHERPPAWREIS